MNIQEKWEKEFSEFIKSVHPSVSNRILEFIQNVCDEAYLDGQEKAEKWDGKTVKL